MDKAALQNHSFIWIKVLGKIRQKVDPRVYDIYFIPSSSRGIDDISRVLEVTVPNLHFKSWLSQNYLNVLREALDESGYEGYEIRFVTESDESLPPVEKPGIPDQQTGSKTTPKSGSPVGSAAYTFDSFIVGDSNRFAHAAAMAVAERPSCAYNPLGIYGSTGLGKTHLMRAISLHIRENFPQMRVRCISSETFVIEFTHSTSKGNGSQFREKYRNIDILMIDDIQFLANKKKTQEEFFHMFNALYDAQKQIVVTSDVPPKKIEGLEARIYSRFEWGLLADILPPELDTRIRILRNKAAVSRTDLPTEVAEYIARGIKSNVRELEGALLRLIAYSRLSGEILNLQLCRKVLGQMIEERDQVVSIDSIQKTVAERFSLRVSELKSRNNSKRITEPRQIAMFLCKEMTENSLSQIGKQFGGKHHTTVMHAIRKIDEQIRKDFKTRTLMERLKVDLM
ncbi:MAG: chromosomal replication initiator protein DnaA [Acidobacteriota bacterium]